MLAILLLTLCLLSSCSTTVYQSTHLINIYAGAKKNHRLKKTLNDHHEFYMWGLLPKEQIVNIDKLAIKNGLSEFSLMRIEEFQTFKQYFMSLVTFGMYIPRSFSLVGHGIKSGI